MQEMIPKPLNISGTYNTRDLGGYNTSDGRITRKNRILRSDGLQSLSTSDKEALYSYGVRVIIDMRSKGEVFMGKCSMKKFKDVKYYHVPLLDHIHSESDGSDFPDSLHEMYIDLYENSKEAVCEVLRIISENPDDCVLYNCMAGKDRTGIISALMLMLASVPREAVIADYAATEEYLEEFISKRKKLLSTLKIDIPDYLFKSPAVEMEMAIDWLSASYGDVFCYVKELGLPEESIERLKNKLL